MSQLRDDLIKNNEGINWIPAHIKEGRFGEWLREIKDWAISRERYWGTPIPVWQCEKCNEIKVIGSVKELGQNVGDLHRPYIDEIRLKCECGGEMKRIPEVMDCWFDSGSMPFAAGVDYPADFIAEAIDQTRGWFYTLLAVATMLGKGAPYKNVICLGHVLDKNGQKMSKSKGNVVDPMEMIEKYGADTVRWYMYTINQPGDPKSFDEKDLKEARKVFMTLVNVLTFYKTYKNDAINQSSDNILDKWIIDKLNTLIKEVAEGLEKYDITASARKIGEFIIDLSQWYVRRSRERFKNEKGAQKTLYDVLLSLSKVIAPFAPFTAEYVYYELTGSKNSVHLQDWPKVKSIMNDELRIMEEMEKVRHDVSIGLDLRLKAGVRVRQPLSLFETPNKLDEELAELIKKELNVKEVKVGKEYKLDTQITEELKQEGALRDLMRAIQGHRKKLGLKPGEPAEILIQTSAEGRKFIENHMKEIKELNVKELKFTAKKNDNVLSYLHD